MTIRLLVACLALIVGLPSHSTPASARSDDDKLTTNLMTLTANFALGKTTGLPHYDLIKQANLDLSLKSLQSSDAYLSAVRADLPLVDGKADLGPIASDVLGSLVVNVGAYVGEVIRVNAKPNTFQWYERADWLAAHPDLKAAMEDPSSFRFGTTAVLGTDDGFGMLPMEQVAAILVFGPRDSVLDFAKSAGSHSASNNTK